MKTKFAIKDIVYICLFAALSAISVCALVFSLSDIDTKFLQFDQRGHRELLGAFVSAMSLVIAVIFVILAISAYGNISKIKKTKKRVDKILKHCSSELVQIQQKKEEFHKEIEETLFAFNDEQIQLAEKHELLKWKNELMVKRARMAGYTMFDSEMRIKLLFELAYVGDDSDVELIKRIIKEGGSNEIKTAAKFALEELTNRLSNRQGK